MSEGPALYDELARVKQLLLTTKQHLEDAWNRYNEARVLMVSLSQQMNSSSGKASEKPSTPKDGTTTPTPKPSN